MGLCLYIYFFLINVCFSNPTCPLRIYQVHEGAIGCLEQTNNLGNLVTGTLTWSPQGHH